MENKTSYLSRVIYMGAFLMVSCTGSGMSGCSSSAGGPTVDSELFGVYKIDRFQVTPTDEASQNDPDICDKLADSDPQPAYLVVYSFQPNDNPDRASLGGIFCADVEQCRDFARQSPEPVLGYSFTVGGDTQGWRGWGIQGSGKVADQCSVDVQVHTLTSTAATIDIQTRTVRTVFKPRPEDIDGTDITCRIADAIDALRDDLACIGAFSLQATFEASL